MSRPSESSPDRPGRGTRRLWLYLLCAGLAPVVMFLVVSEPTLLSLPVAVGFLFFALSRPVDAVGVFAVAHVATPAYVRAPIPGPYQPPVSTAVLLALAGIGILAFLGGKTLPALDRRSRTALALLGVFAVVALVSLIDPSTGGEGISMWLKVFLFPSVTVLAVVATCYTPADVNRIFCYLLAGAVIASLYGIYEHQIGRNPLLDMFPDETDAVYYTKEVLGDIAYRAFSVYGNPLEFASFLGMLFPFALIRFSTAHTALPKTLFGVAIFIIAVGLFVTYSRAPLASLVLATGVVAIFQPGLRKWLLGFAVAAMVLLAMAWPYIGPGISDRLKDVDNLTLRLKLWETALTIFRENPVIGVGIGNFPNYYIEIAREHRIGPFYEFGAGNLEIIRVAENTYLQLAAEMGVVGIAAAIAFFGTALAMGLRLSLAARDPAARFLAQAAIAGFVAYGANGMFITSYTHFFTTLLLIGFLFAFLLVLSRYEEAGAPTDAPEPTFASARNGDATEAVARRA